MGKTWRDWRRDPLREQAHIEKVARDAKAARLVHVATYDQEVPVLVLAERFAWPPDTIAQILRRAGLKTDRRDEFAADWNRRHRRAQHHRRTRFK